MNGVPASLPEAASEGHLSVVKRLIKAGADVNGKAGVNSPLVKAAKGGHLDIVEMLLAAGADANGATAYDTALTAAAGRGHLSIVDTLLRAGANVNAMANSDTALSKAVKGGHADVAGSRLASGANANAETQDLNAPDPATYGSSKRDIVKRLLAAGADDTTPDNPVLFHLLRRSQIGPICPILLEHEAKLSSTTRPRTLLHMAATYKYSPYLTVALVAAGVNTNAVDADGRTALHIAAELGHQEIVEKLYRQGNAINAQDQNEIPPYTLLYGMEIWPQR
ncbi:uncharacterized protein PG986_010529 [Apiospora aurea]|uniref:Ankyrin repeat protein n=1 Tax=Apiospora aurea TaxID=335848 RepID=A0ABR1Q3R3_9PEZI